MKHALLPLAVMFAPSAHANGTVAEMVECVVDGYREAVDAVGGDKFKALPIKEQMAFNLSVLPGKSAECTAGASSEKLDKFYQDLPKALAVAKLEILR